MKKIKIYFKFTVTLITLLLLIGLIGHGIYLMIDSEISTEEYQDWARIKREVGPNSQVAKKINESMLDDRITYIEQSQLIRLYRVWQKETAKNSVK